jgi:hypothetical protein
MSYTNIVIVEILEVCRTKELPISSYSQGTRHPMFITPVSSKTVMGIKVSVLSDKDQVDKRIRRITDVDIVCENLFRDSDHDGDDDVFRLTMVDRRMSDIPARVLDFYAKPIFNLFDSTERINPFLLGKSAEKKWKDNVEKITKTSR